MAKVESQSQLQRLKRELQEQINADREQTQKLFLTDSNLELNPEIVDIKAQLDDLTQRVRKLEDDDDDNGDDDD